MEPEPPFKRLCSRESSDDEPYGLTCESDVPYEIIYLSVQSFTKAFIWFFLRHVHSGWLLGYRNIIKLFFVLCDAKNGKRQIHDPNAICEINQSYGLNGYDRNLQYIINRHVYFD